MLFGEGVMTAPKAHTGPADPLSEPFAELPLEMSAVLVDMRISMAAIAAIKPGSVLPVAVARNVPLRVGDKTIATGSVGAADDRVAIRITQAFA
jgi:flagellar motor switch protein FliM